MTAGLNIAYEILHRFVLEQQIAIEEEKKWRKIIEKGDLEGYRLASAQEFRLGANRRVRFWGEACSIVGEIIRKYEKEKVVEAGE